MSRARRAWRVTVCAGRTAEACRCHRAVRATWLVRVRVVVIVAHRGLAGVGVGDCGCALSSLQNSCSTVVLHALASLTPRTPNFDTIEYTYCGAESCANNRARRGEKLVQVSDGLNADLKMGRSWKKFQVFRVPQNFTLKPGQC